MRSKHTLMFLLYDASKIVKHIEIDNRITRGQEEEENREWLFNRYTISYTKPLLKSAV